MRYLLLVLAVCFLAACDDENPGNNPDAAGHHHTLPQTAPTTVHTLATSNLGDSATQTLMNMVNRYYALKNAFVATNAAQVRETAGFVTLSADSLRILLAADPAKQALKPFLDTIVQKSILIAAAQDESCEKQRILFELVSNNIYRLLKGAEVKNSGVYHEFCPMAFNEKGAFWLSNDPDIKNPYFGKKMLECGEVTDSLK